MAGFYYLKDFFMALRGKEGKLDLSTKNDIKALARFSLSHEDLSSPNTNGDRACDQPIPLNVTERCEKS